jgi:pterin-4a-carbinolamine dehydratase
MIPDNTGHSPRHPDVVPEQLQVDVDLFTDREHELTDVDCLLAGTHKSGAVDGRSTVARLHKYRLSNDCAVRSPS